MAAHSNIPAWRIPWTEEPGGLQSMGFQRVRHDSVTKHTYAKENEEGRGVLLEISYFIEESCGMQREKKKTGNVYLIFLHILLCLLLVTSTNYL